MPLLFEPALELGIILNAVQIGRQVVGGMALIGLDALQ
jgi:hypothetical protein